MVLYNTPKYFWIFGGWARILGPQISWAQGAAGPLRSSGAVPK